ncbi:MAG: type II toxin-antitoxin system VapC family toxin [Candidatus Binatia bacterium]
MILYLDTSSLVKLYVSESESPAAKQLVEEAEITATCRLTYVEARAAFARKRRERGVTPKDYRNLVQDFDNDWESYFIVDISDALVKLAGRLAERHALRGYDAIHLASAVTLRREGDQPVAFSCFDGRLSLAARREGLKIIS